MLTVPDPGILLLLLPGVNGSVFLLYAIDKRQAVHAGWRIARTTLLFSALVGPFGALAAMHIFRHKTRQIRFLLVPLCCLLQILAVLWLATGSF